MEDYIVSVGEFKVTANPLVVLQTVVGSCVGIAMYDPEAMIGGLAHIVLPAGTEEKEKTTPARYARSGIPLLLSEMVKSGASRERIVATVAGGGLILSGKKLSVEMNIGRRNSRMASQVLNMAGIPIVKEDIGGHLGRVLRIEVATGKSDIRTVVEKRYKGIIPDARGEVSFKALIKKIDELKPLSEIARRVISRIEYSEPDLADLERYILKDQALTANILRVCNSAYYGFQHRIASIRKAVVLLGMKTLKNIVLAASLYNLYNDRIKGYFLGKGEMSKHSVCCGMVSQLIAVEKKLGDPDIVFTAGLLHDIGKVILDQYAFERLNLIMDQVLNEEMPFVMAENKILGHDHAQVGGLIAKEWSLPDVLTEAISFHHQPDKAMQNPEVVSIVHIADVICSMADASGGADGLANRIHQFAISSINFQEDDVERIIEKLPEIMKQGETFFGI